MHTALKVIIALAGCSLLIINFKYHQEFKQAYKNSSSALTSSGQNWMHARLTKVVRFLGTESLTQEIWNEVVSNQTEKNYELSPEDEFQEMVNEEINEEGELLSQLQWEEIYRNQTIERNRQRLKTTGVSKYHEYSLQPNNKSLNADTDMLILVFVRSDGFKQRQFVRSSMGKINKVEGIKLKYQVRFVVGTGLNPNKEKLNLWKAETEEYRDIILLDAEDTYHTLVFKEISSFEWALEAVKSHSGSAKLKWIMKMDDDVLYHPIKLDSLVMKYHHLNHSSKHIICKGIFDGKSVRDVNHKWYISKYEYPKENFPEYCYGPSYILTVAAVQELVYLFELNYHTEFIWLEDVLLTGILANEGNITRLETNNNLLLRTWPFQKRNLGYYISFHMSGLGIQKLENFWKTFIQKRLKMISS